MYVVKLQVLGESVGAPSCSTQINVVVTTPPQLVNTHEGVVRIDVNSRHVKVL